MKYAPVIIPTLCRFEHFQRCIESLKSNGWASCTDVFIGLDYPPLEKYRPGWEKIKLYLSSSDFSAFASFTVLEQKKNIGASANSRILREHILSLGFDRWIYAEDDLEFSPNFIEYIDKCLDFYEDDPDVVGVTGYSYPIDWSVSEGATCFKQKFNASTWGTGYWKKKTEPIRDYLSNCGLKKALPNVLKYKLYEDMIDTAKIEYFNEAFSIVHYLRINLMRVHSDLALRAYLAVEDKYYITPVISKTRNYGFDGSGANCKDTSESGKDPSKYRIDGNAYFSLCPDETHDYQVNRDKMNSRETRTKKEMRRTNALINMADLFGIWSSKLFLLILVPIDLMKIAIHKYKG